MASFDENGKYIKTNWKAGDKITATKLNKIEESIEAVNDNDISRHVEADARLDALEAKNVAHDKEFTNVKNLIEDAKAAAELGDYEINSRMQFLEDDVEQAVNDMNNAVTTMRNEMNAHTNTVNVNVDNKISAFETEFDAEVAGLKAVDETIQNDVSEIQNDIENAQTQTFTVTDDYKFAVDHDGMVSSLVTLNNIEGLSSVETNSKGSKEIVSRSINHICTIDKSKNYFDDAVLDTIHGDTTTNTRENNDITVTSNAQGGAVAYSVTNLEEGKKYCMLCDDIIITQGDAHFQAATPIEYKPLRSTTQLKFSHYNVVFIGNEICTITFHCSRSSNSGDVTYFNVQIYEVKEMIVPNIQLNSLPNGVKDEIKDGMLIKRTGIDNSNNVYELETPEYIPVNLTIKADKGDTVVINTTKTMDLTYDIQLNTRAQIDSVQDLVSNHQHGEYLPLSGGTITGSLSIGDSNDAYKQILLNRTMGGYTGKMAFSASSYSNIPCSGITTHLNGTAHGYLFTDVGFFPVNANVYDLGRDSNRWRNIYSHPFNMYVEENGYTSRLKANRGNFRLADGYDTTIFAWSHDYSQIGPDVTNVVNLGSANYRFKSIYLNAQPNVSSDRTLKENIKYINSDESDVSYEDMYAFVKDDLELATYNLVEHDKLNMGFIAQDLLVNLDGTDNKVGQMIVNPVPIPTEEEIEEGTPYPTLSYDTGMYTSVLAGALKEAINKIEQLEARINELENK